MVRGCAIFRVPFYDRVLIYGYRFKQSFTFPGLMGMVLIVKIHLLVSFFPDFWIYGYDFQKLFRIYG